MEIPHNTFQISQAPERVADSCRPLGRSAKTYGCTSVGTRGMVRIHHLLKRPPHPVFVSFETAWHRDMNIDIATYAGWIGHKSESGNYNGIQIRPCKFMV